LFDFTHALTSTPAATATPKRRISDRKLQTSFTQLDI